jgi:hypothetical protein
MADEGLHRAAPGGDVKGLFDHRHPSSVDRTGVRPIRAAMRRRFKSIRPERATAWAREAAMTRMMGGPSLIEVPAGEMPDPWPTLIMPRVRRR